MSRALSPAERALWRRVVADIQPALPVTEGPLDPIVSAPAPVAAPAPTPALVRVHPAPLSRVGNTELDASWEKRLRAGETTPDRVVDLHGLTAAEAHRRAIAAIETASMHEARLVLLITGKAPPRGSTRLDQPLRGIIRASLADWIAASPIRTQVVAVRAAHRRHGGEGAVYVILRRHRAAPR